MTKNMRIIYCEDESAQRRMVYRIVDSFFDGVKIDTLPCAHNLSGIQGEVDLLISDGNMKSSTYEDSIRYRDELFPNTPIVILTADVMLVDELSKKGITAVSKVGGINALLEAIEKETPLRRA